MTEAASSSDSEQVAGHQRMLGLLLAAAMFVLVVDTSLMNVSISAVVRDLGTTVSGVQSAMNWLSKPVKPAGDKFGSWISWNPTSLS